MLAWFQIAELKAALAGQSSAGSSTETPVVSVATNTEAEPSRRSVATGTEPVVTASTGSGTEQVSTENYITIYTACLHNSL